MKRNLLLIFLAVFFVVGCAARNTQKYPSEQRKYFAIFSNDRVVAIEVHSYDRKTLNGITIEPARAVTAALSGKINAVSKHFEAPEEIAEYEDRPKSELGKYILFVELAEKNKGDGYAVLTSAASLADQEWYMKVLEARTYRVLTDIQVSCTGDTPQVCSQKFADAVTSATMPVVTQFIKDRGY
jgi:hypothetical protein